MKTKKIKLTTTEKGVMIGNIIEKMRLVAMLNNRHFDGGDVFFGLVFKTDEELKKIAQLTFVN